MQTPAFDVKAIKTSMIFFGITPEKCLDITLCPAGQRNLYPKQVNLAKEHRPEQAPAQIGVVTGVVTAVVRTVVHTIGKRTVRVVEHPKRDRREFHNSTVATDLNLQPIPVF